MKTQAESQSKRSVLLVDDDKFLLDLYALKFSQLGFATQAASSVADALKTLREGFIPDTILFDLIMPGGDGFSFLEALRREGLAKGATKIALTNEMSEEEKKRTFELGATDYIVKATMIPSEVVEKVAGRAS